MSSKEFKIVCLCMALVVITVAIFIACSKDASTATLLRDAESLMEEKPDSAYALLQQAGSMVTFPRPTGGVEPVGDAGDG